MLFPEFKGTIALDIDGTVTAEAELIPVSVVNYLASLHQSGWSFIFITGRPFQWGARSLKVLPFPYALGVQNGALLLHMPSEKILARKYLGHEWLASFEMICRQYETDFVIYTGFENNDHCYYRPSKLPGEVLHYVNERKRQLGERWIPYDHFDELKIGGYAALKCFLKLPEAQLLSCAIETKLGLHAPVIKDPFSSEYYVIQATHGEATKGGVLKEYLTFQAKEGPVVAAGNDNNDLTLLTLAHVRIAMEDSPEEMLKMANIIAPTAEKMGIIEALKEGIQRLEEFYV